MAQDELDYPTLVRRALLGVVRDVLQRTAREGLVGEHHFYLTFRTGAEGVQLSGALRARQGDEMTIVLQHQFRDLRVDEEGFAVTLRFDGRPERVRVPFEALVSFTDPAVPLGLRFAAGEEERAGQSVGEELGTSRADADRRARGTGAARVVPFRPQRVPSEDR